jgi:hypothetical protein
MSANLLVASLWSRPDQVFDFAAGQAAVKALSYDQVVDAVGEAAPWVVDEPATEEDAAQAARTYLADQVAELAGEFTNLDERRHLSWMDTPSGEWRCWVTGGTSWGESPSDLFDAINTLWWTPSVLAAIGFTVPEKEVTT